MIEVTSGQAYRKSGAGQFTLRPGDLADYLLYSRTWPVKSERRKG